MASKKRNIRRPQQFEVSKVEGYFMISKQDALLAVSNKLTSSQFRLWIYLMAIDSFGDYTSGGEIKYHDLPSVPDIAVSIGSSLDTVEKDLRKLRKLGLYEFRTVTVQGHNLTAAKAKAEADRLSKAKSESSLKHAQGKGSAYLSGESAYLSEDSAYLSPKKSSKPLQSKDSSAPHTIQTYTDFKKTLSEEEREKFLNFVREKTKNFSPQINDIEGWLAKKNEAEQNRWEVYYDLFQKSQPKFVQASQNALWKNHPHRDEWLTEIESSGNPAMFAGSDKQKQAFVSWCWETKQFSWLKEEGNDGI